ncbi:Mu transposase C-terminal domain-containing protein [Salinarimonas soli]|uniref:Transposase n=1 Tax=Salinarimonas soli TaxID=1638099 RepID=A0A5B2V948_9HYPH|nr:Mu transposase C-terminal domain-containing protein [Salinarimonas soli]KAA2234912.1 transposase [Salinarimonas soli]
MNAPLRPGLPGTPFPGALDFLSGTTVVETRRFDLRSGTVFKIRGRTWRFDRRIAGKLEFICLEDKEPDFHTDEEFAALCASGDAWIVAGEGSFGEFRLPARVTLSPAQEAEADRKLDYIEACLSGHVKDDPPPRSVWEFRRSAGALDPIIHRLAALNGETPVHFTTVLDWLDRWVALGDIYGKACLVGRTAFRGNRKRGIDHMGEIALERGVVRWLNPKVTKATAYAKVCRTVEAYKRQLVRGGVLTREEAARIVAPSERTFQRRCKQIDRYTRDYYRRGPAYANKTHRTYETTPIPDRPYQDVEVDHCTMDILLEDDDTGIVLGRPDVLVFRDRATGMIVGRHVGFEGPSYASFVMGLRHAMYPKDMTHLRGVTVPWPCFGRIENLWVDNALHLIKDDIERGARELKINKPRFRPRCPWTKGALERFFGYQNTGLVHMLPGSTMSHALERKDFDSEVLDRARMKRSEFEALFDVFICHVANAGLAKGLGVIRGVGDIPLRVWSEKAARHPSGPLPPPDLFIALCGEWETRTIQNNGITWEYIVYESPELIRLITHPEHKNARENGGGTLYRVCRDPNDLGRLYVENPYEPERPVIVVPASRAHARYAEGLHRHVHRVVIENAQKQVREELDFDTLMRVRDMLGEVAVAARGRPERKKVQRRLARFMEGERQRRFASRVVPGRAPDETTAAHLDPLAAAGRRKSRVAPAVATAPLAQPEEEPSPVPAVPAPPADSPAPVPLAKAMPSAFPADDDDDLASLKAANNWSSDDE